MSSFGLNAGTEGDGSYEIDEIFNPANAAVAFQKRGMLEVLSN